MKMEKTAKKNNEKILAICKNKSCVNASYHASGAESVQAELRLNAEWSIKYPVDQITYPKNLAHNQNPLWAQMWDLRCQIEQAAHIKSDSARIAIPISAKRKNGDQLRAEARAAWEVEIGKRFLADYRSAIKKSTLATIRKTISALQTQQQALLPQLRAANSAYLAGKKTEREAQAAKNTAALTSGRFWEADKDILKKYFHPPFDKNYLADVSERWRAALFLECKSISYKWGGNWRHKLGGTRRGYLCGIDDNGDEWGHRIERLPQSHDQHGNAALDTTVEEAMSELFGLPVKSLANCQRQGDLLFCRVENLPAGIEIDPVDDWDWEVRESHVISSIGLHRNGRYLQSAMPIRVTHTSHPELLLPPGDYRLYTIEIAEAD